MDFQLLISCLSLALGWIFAGAFYIVLYIFMSISLYSIGKRSSVKHLWFAFVPLLQYYIIGEICEEYQFLGFRIKKLGLLTALLFFLEFAIEFSRFTPLLIVVAIFKALIFHKFYSLFTQRRALLYTAISTLGSIPLTIILFLIKDAPMYMSAAAYRYPFPDKM